MWLLNLSVDCYGLGVKIFNDSGTWKYPLVALELEAFRVILERTAQGTLVVRSKISLQGLFYNTRLLRWEPFLEPWSVVIEHAPHTAPEENFDGHVLTLVSERSMEWNISSTMLQIFTHALEERKENRNDNSDKKGHSHSSPAQHFPFLIE